MAAFHLGERVVGLWYCARSLTDMASGTFNRMEPSLTSLVTPVLFKLSALKRGYQRAKKVNQPRTSAFTPGVV